MAIQTSIFLQGVEVSINSLGLRGPEPVPGRPAVVLAGDSMTLGWGVAESGTLAGQLARRLGDDMSPKTKALELQDAVTST